LHKPRGNVPRATSRGAISTMKSTIASRAFHYHARFRERSMNMCGELQLNFSRKGAKAQRRNELNHKEHEGHKDLMNSHISLILLFVPFVSLVVNNFDLLRLSAFA
jgi:hypothetical protein